MTLSRITANSIAQEPTQEHFVITLNYNGNITTTGCSYRIRGRLGSTAMTRRQ